jgi:hypothetical protein
LKENGKSEIEGKFGGSQRDLKLEEVAIGYGDHTHGADLERGVGILSQNIMGKAFGGS